MSDRRTELFNLTDKVVMAFNEMNIDKVVKLFSGDGIYEDSVGVRHEGRDAIRVALEPLMGGVKGKINFDGEEFFAEVETGRVLISWRLSMELDDNVSVIRGLDVLQFNDDDTLAKKMAYMKVDKPHLESQ